MRLSREQEIMAREHLASEAEAVEFRRAQSLERLLRRARGGKAKRKAKP